METRYRAYRRTRSMTYPTSFEFSVGVTGVVGLTPRQSVETITKLVGSRQEQFVL